MANTKKNIEEEIVDVEVEVKPAKKVNKPKHDPAELIECRSMVFGELMLIGPKTRMRYSWANEGDVREVEYQDLVSWRALHSPYLFNPMIIIENEEISIRILPIDTYCARVGRNDIFALVCKYHDSAKRWS